MAGGSVQLSGFSELEAKLKELPELVAKRATVRAMKRAGDVMAQDMRSRAPRGPTGRLAGSIGISAKSRNLTGLAEYAGALSAGGTHRDAQAALRAARSGGGSAGTRIFMLIGSTAPHAHLVERGTAARYHKSGKSVGVMPAEPFVLPAFLVTKDSALAAIRDELVVEIGKAKGRIARKAAREASIALVNGV